MPDPLIGVRKEVKKKMLEWNNLVFLKVLTTELRGDEC